MLSSRKCQRNLARRLRHLQFLELAASVLLPDLVGIRDLNCKRDEFGRYSEPVLKCRACLVVWTSTAKLRKRDIQFLQEIVRHLTIFEIDSYSSVWTVTFLVAILNAHPCVDHLRSDLINQVQATECTNPPRHWASYYDPSYPRCRLFEEGSPGSREA